eukprot:2120342-Pleurochrysis_carterae.AAC.1
MLVFPGGQVLLLSEWEAEHILTVLLTASTSPGVFLANLSYLCEAADSFWRKSPKLSTASRLTCRSEAINEATIAGLQLLAGDTMFATEERKASVNRLLASPGAKRAALRIVALRGCQHMVRHSDLELICNVDIGDE